MKIIFAGTPEVALPSLKALLEGPHEVVHVVTRPDAPLGRKRVLTPSPVAALAEEAGVPTTRAARLGGETGETLAQIEADLGVVVAYGGLIREPLLSSPKHGWINLHFSRLPAWRGAAPVQHALINGDTEIGTDIFKLVAELDAGEIISSETQPVDPDITAGELLAALAETGAAQLARTVDAIADGSATSAVQQGEPSFAGKLGLDDALMTFDTPAHELYNRYRGVTPEPGAYTLVDGARFKILRAARATETDLEAGAIRLVGKRVLVGTLDGALELLRVQPAGKQAMDAGSWWRGLGADPTPRAALSSDLSATTSTEGETR
ncbi:methionyl-tRNA formyltransferase [Mycetocola saprophilus]|uniref:methionyl-tRNA formyltransferase n=1 Tax=Mycetocola saprophilus TaxID=76636 RepID=UPI003BF4120E